MSTLGAIRSQVNSILNTSGQYDDEIDASIRDAVRNVEENVSLEYMKSRVTLLQTTETLIDGNTVDADSFKFPVFKQAEDYRGLTQGDYKNGIPASPQTKRFDAANLYGVDGTWIRPVKRIQREDLPGPGRDAADGGAVSHYYTDGIRPRTGQSAVDPQRLWIGLYEAAGVSGQEIRIDAYVFTDPLPLGAANDATTHWLYTNARLLLVYEAVTQIAPVVRDAGLLEVYSKLLVKEWQKFNRWVGELAESDETVNVGSDIWGEPQ